ncbi:hypothetical protein [Ancylobacter vacuolatus]|uniref:Chromosome segregation ATPase n=1 Tax=Ancylobacter vacuolatus TaxID=223389 RepID=A0ABU0DCN6_9HYPH|nr:hypothetical protein [Ancylobacter vacuolatus]MDQ0346106.1 chromosome segregation ATPase [Ancylobacter vacuolatus]
MNAEKKSARTRGLRDVATVQTRLTRATPSNRTQAVSRFARLENERTRLLRELEAWSARRTEAERMLAKVDEELATMRTMLLDAPASPPREAQAPRRRRERDEPAATPTAHSHALIEY